MVNSTDLQREVTASKLEELLKVGGEDDSLDFKEVFSIKTQHEKAELVRDMLAFANSEGGGHIIFGVADQPFEPVGLTSNTRVDTTLIYQVISRYITNLRFMAAVHDLQWPSWSTKRRFAILKICEYPGIAMPGIDVAYEDEVKKKSVVLVRASDIMVRRGAQSIRAEKTDKALKDPEELANYSERQLNSRVFRAIVINLEQFEQINKMYQFLDRWLREHPGDPYAISEGQRLGDKYPQITEDNKFT